MDFDKEHKWLVVLALFCVLMAAIWVIVGCGAKDPPPPIITTVPVLFRWDPPAHIACGVVPAPCTSSYKLMDRTSGLTIATPSGFVSSVTLPINTAALYDEFALSYTVLEADGTMTIAPQAVTVIVRK